MKPRPQTVQAAAVAVTATWRPTITRADTRGGQVRLFAVVLAAAMSLGLLPLEGVARAQEDDSIDDPDRTCPPDWPAADFDDRDRIPHVHVCNVDQAAALGIVVGFADGQYKPQLPVTRGQMASFVFRGLDAVDVRLPAAGEERFADVPPDSAHDEPIHRLAAAGVMRGGPLHMGEDQYGPQLLLRRDQMASFLMRAVGYALFDDPDHYQDWPASAPDDAALSDDYPDVPPANAHYGNVHAGNWHTMVFGFTDGTYRPGSLLRRDQLGSAAARMVFFLTRPVQVEITDQSVETATVGETVEVTATVSDQFTNPWAGLAAVHFRAEGAGVTPAETQTVTTDDNGHAAFAFSSTQEETVTVTTWIDGPGGNFSAADGDRDTREIFVGS